MKTCNNFHVILFLVLGLSSFNANAALIDRGGGLIYDTELNITWLQDANYSGITMNWGDANTWAANLSYYDSVRNITWDDWRLPTVAPINGSTFNYITSYNGSTDRAYNISEQGTLYAGSTQSEMAHLYYNSLNNLALCSLSSPASSCTSQSGSGLSNIGPFTNIQSYIYWSGTEYVGNAPSTNYAWVFDFSRGLQYDENKPSGVYAWAVRTGDVAAVPIPAAFWLFGSGLIGLFGFMRRG